MWFIYWMMILISEMMRLFDAILIVPLYETFIIFNMILLDAMYFGSTEKNQQDATSKLWFYFGILICILGMFILTMAQKGNERSNINDNRNDKMLKNINENEQKYLIDDGMEYEDCPLIKQDIVDYNSTAKKQQYDGLYRPDISTKQMYIHPVIDNSTMILKVTWNKVHEIKEGYKLLLWTEDESQAHVWKIGTWREIIYINGSNKTLTAVNIESTHHCASNELPVWLIPMKSSIKNSSHIVNEMLKRERQMARASSKVKTLEKMIKHQNTTLVNFTEENTKLQKNIIIFESKSEASASKPILSSKESPVINSNANQAAKEHASNYQSLWISLAAFGGALIIICSFCARHLYKNCQAKSKNEIPIVHPLDLAKKSKQTPFKVAPLTDWKSNEMTQRSSIDNVERNLSDDLFEGDGEQAVNTTPITPSGKTEDGEDGETQHQL